MNDLILLAALMQGPQHGYALKKLAGFLAGQDTMHNNLVYPLLRRFGQNDWVTKRTTSGKRGQERDIYSLTAKGKIYLYTRLAQFTEKEAASQNEFRLRVGLFSVLDQAARANILAERDRWLAAREQRLESLQIAMEEIKADLWGTAVMTFYLSQIRVERKWILELARKAAQPAKGQSRVKTTRKN
jgi:DNA-binding PadR family transcriptional regulator